MNWVKKMANVFFEFTRGERNGIIILLFLILFLAIVRFIIPHFSNNKHVDVKSFDLKVERLAYISDSIKIAKERSKKNFYSSKYQDYSSKKVGYDDSSKNRSSKYVIGKSNEKYSDDKNEIVLRDFDPNTEDREALLLLGFKEFQVNAMLNYRAKGGRYKQSIDLLKIYGIDSVFFKMILPYIKIEKEKPKEVVVIELNSADTVQLKELRGIGSSYAKRIVKYRDDLGGFVNKQQLLEVFKFPQELYSSIEAAVTVDSLLIKKIDLNFVDFKTLNQHPYCSYETTKKILNYRSKKGSFATSKQLLTDSVLKIDEFNKLRPYLSPQ